MLDPLFRGFAYLIAFFYSLVSSYGLAIVMLTITVRLVLFPLTAKQARSMQAMQRVQPELKRLQQKHKNDRQKLNEEMMKFYKENQINPLAGCLPLLLQLPLFIVLFRVIDGLTKTKTVDGKLVGDPRYIDKSTDLHAALERAGGKVVSWGIDLADSASEATSRGFLDALPYFVLVALVIATGWYQQRQMTARNPQAAANPQAQLMGKIFPIMFGVISYGIQSGVVVYFIVSNLWQIGQQALIFRTRPNPTGGVLPGKATPKADGDGEKPASKSDGKGGSPPPKQRPPRPQGAQSRSKKKGRK